MPSKKLLRLDQCAELHCPSRAAVVIKPVSADSLRRTGIFADKAGDFRRFPLKVGRTGRPETKSNARKAGISGTFSRFLVSPAECRTAWLGREDSNSRIPDRTRSLREFSQIWEYQVCDRAPEAF